MSEQGELATSIRRNQYLDSISLLQLTAAVSALPGVLGAALVMATDLNLEVLRELRLFPDEGLRSSSNDLLVAIRATDRATAQSAMVQAEALLASPPSTSGQSTSESTVRAPRSLRSAHRRLPRANLALISVPGPFAAAEARQALADGLNVFLFSDNVSIEDEVSLKRQARAQGLLVMGPDCGTAIIGGVGLGFANVVRRGRVGLIGASGTGLQEVTCLLHQAGEGVSHAIGTGGRDLSAAVGGITTRQALQLLADDTDTEVIVLISKPAPREVTEQVLSEAVASGKSVVACMLGSPPEPRPGVAMAGNLYQAARLAAKTVRRAWPSVSSSDLPKLRLLPGLSQVRGLFCGGTLADEAEIALQNHVERVLIDFGDDRYTRGRAHPMIDPTIRNAAIVEAGADPRVAVLLLDVILGRAAHPDPAASTAPAILDARAAAAAAGRQLVVLAHVVGTDADPQGLSQQEARLRAAGVHLFGSSYHAAVAASLVMEGVAP